MSSHLRYLTYSKPVFMFHSSTVDMVIREKFCKPWSECCNELQCPGIVLYNQNPIGSSQYFCCVWIR